MAQERRKEMLVLVACEESQAVCKAFRALGHEAYSNDLQPCSGGHPEWHKQYDCRIAIQERFWDLIIFHPDCTAMAVSGNRYYAKGKPLYYKREEAIRWTVTTWLMVRNYSVRACLENPVSVIFNVIPVAQYVQPWMFGHGETKKTGLALHNLPLIKPTNTVDGREQRIWKMPPSKNRKELRSKTYPGIAWAFAHQWGTPVLGEKNPLPEHCGSAIYSQPTGQGMQAG